ncbi:hypothetical protein [Clavibacter michiganensis]|uniref:hypothetical protein n=1 Tax=Clavibacter michiganensis TaxID=28447 RepID=UPI00293143D6|nr:hypothetical protein [Clavibacter michiganensis]
MADGKRVRGSRKLTRARLWQLLVTDNFVIFSALSGVALGANEVIDDDAKIQGLSLDSAAYGLGVIFLVLGAYRGYVVSTDYSAQIKELATSVGLANSRREAAEIEISEQQGLLKSLIESLLAGIAREHGVYDANHRLSAYVHNGSDFVMIARVSHNPELARPGRSIYPDNQGIIGEAWRKGHSEKRNFKSRRELHNKQLVDSYNYTARQANALSMQSRSITGIRIDADTQSNHHIGVIVFECENANGYDEGLYDRVRANSSWGVFTAVMSSSEELLPDISFAGEVGF